MFAALYEHLTVEHARMSIGKSGKINVCDVDRVSERVAGGSTVTSGVVWYCFAKSVHRATRLAVTGEY